MNTDRMLRPIVLIGPPWTLAEVRAELVRAGVAQPLCLFRSLDDGRDFLEAAAIAASYDDRYTPCLTLVDAMLPEGERSEFLGWAREQEALAGMRISLVTDGRAAPVSPEGEVFDEWVSRHSDPEAWRVLVARTCS